MLMMEIKRILQSLEEGSVKLSRGTTKIPTSPSPLVINNEQSLIQKSMMLTTNFFTIIINNINVNKYVGIESTFA